ncbi:MAG: hypothetical protein ACT4OM_00905 [Actinomycetota bacterium]
MSCERLEKGWGPKGPPRRQTVATLSALIGRPALPLVAIAVALSACSAGNAHHGDSAASSSARPASTARLTIVEPVAGAVVTGPELVVRVELEGATVIPQATAKLRPDEGHVHLSLDGELLAMTFGLEHTVAVTPGIHLLQAEFVAGDHAPFRPPVVVVKSFEVQ